MYLKVKNTKIITPAITRIRFEESRSREERKEGTVIELFETSVYVRSRGAVTYQFIQAPMVRPTAIQPSTIPVRYKAPGNPIKSHPDISAAPAESAATSGLSSRPPNL